MKKAQFILIGICLLISTSLQAQLQQSSKANEFKIGMFGFNYTDSSTWSCDNLSYCPITSTIYNGHPSSQGNVLSSDGFNIVINYQPDMYNSTVTFMSALLDLVKNNNLQYYTHARYFFKANTNCIGGTNVYNNNGGGLDSICRARPNFDELYTNVYSNSNYKDVVWGHHITEEASFNHPFNSTDYFIGWNDPQNCLTEVPPTNVSKAIGYFHQKQNSLSISNQKLVVMEAMHGMSINDNTYDLQGIYNPQDYLNIQNKPDVFLEGSYTQFPEDNWQNQNYTAIINNGWHYLGPFKSIDYAYTKVNEVQKVVNIEINNSNYEHHYHSQLAIKNANWLWFQSYTSIIHNAKGIWFWALNFSWRSDETRATGDDRFELNNFSDAYKKYIRHLARELRFLVNKDIISTDENTIVCDKLDHADLNCIIPPAASYLLPSLGLPSEKLTEEYALRYTIRSNGIETYMIIANPLNISISATLDFSNSSNPIIQNSTGVDLVFYDYQEPVGSPLYKCERNSGINLINNTVEDYLPMSYLPNTNKHLTLSFGPMDVIVLKFVSTPPDYNNGWNEVWSNFGNGHISDWSVLSTDKFYPGDFDGDAIQELLCIQATDNSNDWAAILKYIDGNWEPVWSNGGNNNMSWWGIREHDKFVVGDFDGDNKDELFCVQGESNSNSYAAILQFGTNNWEEQNIWFNYGSGTMSWWGIRINDKFTAGDFDGDNKDELLCIQGESNSNSYATMLQFGTSNWENQNIWSNYGDGTIAGWGIRQLDRFLTGNYRGISNDQLFCVQGDGPYSNVLTYNNGSWVSGWYSNGSIGGWAYPVPLSDQILCGNIDTYDTKDEIMFLQTGSDAGWATTMDLENDQSHWNWNWSANSQYGGHPFIDNWPLAPNNGIDTRYYLIKAKANDPKYLLSMRKFCNKYLVSMYKTSQGDNKKTDMNLIGQDMKSESSNSIKIIPNPSDGKIQITSEKTGIIEIEIFNGKGQSIYKNNFYSEFNIQIDISNHPNGIYLLKTINSENLVSIQKFVINR